MAIDKTKKPGVPTMPVSVKTPARTKTPAKTTPSKSWTIGRNNVEYGEKIIVYGDTGIGKSSLCAMAPNPVFIPIDAGSKNIRHPVTNELVPQIEQDIEGFSDVRDILHSTTVFKDRGTIVVDTVTILQDMAIPYMLATVPTDKGGTAKNIHSYGYNKGFNHQYDVMKLILQDCDALIRSGKNVIFVAQSTPNKISNPGGEDFLRESPRLYAGKPSVEALYCEWADHILRIDYESAFVDEKKITGPSTRAVFTQPELHFRAKTRALKDGAIIPPVVSYESVEDDSIWTFMFGKNEK